MRTIDTNIYEFKELKGVAKERALALINEEWADIQADHWYEDVENMLMDLPIEYKPRSVKYSLSYSQGDGLSYETDRLGEREIEELKERDTNFSVSDLEWDLINKYEYSYRIYQRGRNVHEETMYIDWERYAPEGATVAQVLRDETILEIMSNRFLEEHKKIARRMAKKGYETLYQELLPFEVADYCSDYGIEFLEDGTIYRGGN